LEAAAPAPRGIGRKSRCGGPAGAICSAAMPDHESSYPTDSRWGAVTFLYALLLWGALLGVFLGGGHLLARSMHHDAAHAEAQE